MTATPHPLSPAQAHHALERFEQRCQAALGRACLVAIAVVAGTGIITLLTGWLAWLVIGTLYSLGLLGYHARRYRKRQRSEKAKRIQAGLTAWLHSQEDPGQAARALAESSDALPLLRGWATGFLEDRGIESTGP